jgi:IMP cyclohydrolase
MYLRDALKTNPYPGRLILLARTPEDDVLGCYAICGRSNSARARRIEPTEAGGLSVVPSETAEHDALRHYVAAACTSRWWVFGNGEQVSEVIGRLDGYAVPAAALNGLCYEPDSPIFTPRITAVVDRRDGSAWFGAARRSAGARQGADNTVVAFADLAPGDCVLLSTYRSDGNTVLASRGHLDLRTQAGDMKALLNELWDALDERFRVAAAIFAPLHGTIGPIRHA